MLHLCELRDKMAIYIQMEVIYLVSKNIASQYETIQMNKTARLLAFQGSCLTSKVGTVAVVFTLWEAMHAINKKQSS